VKDRTSRKHKNSNKRFLLLTFVAGYYMKKR